MTKSSTFEIRALESLWLVQTDDRANGMDFRVGFMNSRVVKPVPSRYEDRKWSFIDKLGGTADLTSFVPLRFV